MHGLVHSQHELFGLIYILLHGPVTVKNPKKRRDTLTLQPADGGFEVLELCVCVSTRTRRGRPWYVIPERGGRGLPIRQWEALQEKGVVTIGKYKEGRDA